MAPGERLLAGAFLFVFALLLLLEVLRGHDQARLGILFTLLAWGPLIALHELGHLLMARVVGFSVSEFVVGQGPPLLRTRLGETRVVLRAVPVSGYVVPHSKDGKRARLSMALTYAAGPLAELAVVAGIALYLGPQLLGESQSLGVIAAQSVALAAAMGAVLNLLPLPAGEAVTDGLGIWNSMALSEAAFSWSAAMRYVEESEIALDEGRLQDALELVRSGQVDLPSHPQLILQEGICLASQGEEEAAYERLEAVRNLPGVSHGQEAEALHAAARVVLELDESALLTDALESCRVALRMAPRPQFLITLGRLQLALGQAAQAQETLMAAYRDAKEPAREDRCMAYLATACIELGDAELGQRFLASLRTRKPGARLLQQAEDACRAKGQPLAALP